MQDCYHFEALQSGINLIPVVILETAQKCGKGGDLEIVVLTFIVVVAVIIVM